MRVIGGTSKGRHLRATLPDTVRPTSDRVREAIFDMVAPMWTLRDTAVLDLFCGSGAMGLEALSRGAGSVTFVDMDQKALDAVRENAHSTGLEAHTFSCVAANLPQWLHRSKRFDIAFCDPPYVFSDWTKLLANLDANTAFLESKDPVPTHLSWEVVKVRRYGSTLVTVVERVEESLDMTTRVGMK